MQRHAIFRASAGLVLLAAFASLGRAQEFEREPISYGKTEPQNRVSRLIEQVESGKVRLKFEPRFGYLRSLLKALDVPASSQTLVFSKTSLQRQRISPRTPRALYFSDDVFVGYCQGGEVLEISTADPRLGAVFFTIDQEDVPPNIVRQGDNCLICHGSSQTKEVPGHLVRSVFSDVSGLPILAAGTYRVDQTIPLEKRWVDTMVTEEFGLRLQNPSPLRAALSTFAAFVLAGMVPLVPFVLPIRFSPNTAFGLSAVATCLTFFLIGLAKGRVVKQPAIWSGLQTLAIGGVAAVLAYLVGALLRSFGPP